LSRIVRTVSKDNLIPADPKPEQPTGLGKIVNAVTRFFKKTENKKVPEKSNRITSRIVAVVGTVTNDNRLLQLPQGIKICALRFTNAARARIHKSHG
jgi:ribosomal protein L18E